MIANSNGFMEPETKPLKRLKQLTGVGNIWLYALSIMRKDGKAYAYALDSDIDKKFGFKPSKVMIYLVLYKLEGEGLIQSKMEDRRKYYHLTEKGKKSLLLAKKHLGELSKEL
jgi:DNA-binding PadR family transcriptional regulator